MYRERNQHTGIQGWLALTLLAVIIFCIPLAHERVIQTQSVPFVVDKSETIVPLLRKSFILGGEQCVYKNSFKAYYIPVYANTCPKYIIVDFRGRYVKSKN